MMPSENSREQSEGTHDLLQEGDGDDCEELKRSMRVVEWKRKKKM